jgi:nucleotide-binding universal stress UspA family protein
VHEGLTTKAYAAIELQLTAIIGGTPSADIVLDSGSPHAGLLTQAAAAGAGMIVTGPGRVAGRVVRHATVPVLIARPSAKGVVIGATDFSDPSLPALETAASEARRRESRLHLLHVVDLGAYALGGAAGGLPYLGETPIVALQAIDELRAAAHARLKETLKQFAVEGRASAVSGPAAGTIIGVAESSGAELLVVGTHGRSGFARMTLGSTAETVIDSAPCSVLVVRLARH